MLFLFIEDLNLKIKPRIPEYHHMHRILEECVEPNSNVNETT